MFGIEKELLGEHSIRLAFSRLYVCAVSYFMGTRINEKIRKI